MNVTQEDLDIPIILKEEESAGLPCLSEIVPEKDKEASEGCRCSFG